VNLRAKAAALAFLRASLLFPAKKPDAARALKIFNAYLQQHCNWRYYLQPSPQLVCEAPLHSGKVIRVLHA